MRIVVLPGSFDPFTLGHLDLARRATAFADEVIIAVSHNPSKKNLLGFEERRAIIDSALSEAGLAASVRTDALPDGLLVEYCRSVGAHAVVRGLRGQADLAYEEPMVRMNRHLADIDTVLLLTAPELSHISSSLVREVAALGGEVSDMLPPAAISAVLAAVGR